MAFFQKIKNNPNYFARIRYKTEQGKVKDKRFQLGKNRAIAYQKFLKINEREKLFKAGIIPLEETGNIDYPDIEKLTDSYIGNLETRELKKGTIELYKLGLRDFQNVFKGQDISNLSKTDYEKLLKYIKEKYTNNHTRNIRLRTIKSFFNYLFNSGKIDKIPFKVTQFDVETKKPKYFSNEEMKMIYEEIKGKNPELFCRVMLHHNTGLRLNEFKSAEIKSGLLRVYNPCKRGISRTIPIDEVTANCFNWLKENSTYHPKSISRLFTETLKELKLYRTVDGGTRHFHNLRDTFGTVAYYLTRDIFQVSKWMGHTNKGKPNVETTVIYANFDEEFLREDFGTHTDILKSMENALLRNYRLNHLQKHVKREINIDYFEENIQPENYQTELYPFIPEIKNNEYRHLNNFVKN